MNFRRLAATGLLLAGQLSLHPGTAQDASPSQRAAWTTSRFSGTPDPVLPYTTVNAFPGLSFQRCIDLAALPGSDRLLVAEQGGKFYSFENRVDAAEKELLVDLKKEIEGLNHVYSFAG